MMRTYLKKQKSLMKEGGVLSKTLLMKRVIER